MMMVFIYMVSCVCSDTNYDGDDDEDIDDVYNAGASVSLAQKSVRPNHVLLD